LVLVALLLAAFMINLDTTIVNVALPTLVGELQASTVQLVWIVDAYNLMFAAFVLAAGNLGHRVGRKGVLLVGLLVFGAASFAGGAREQSRAPDRSAPAPRSASPPISMQPAGRGSRRDSTRPPRTPSSTASRSRSWWRSPSPSWARSRRRC
jgi:hypothetical protein